jgi:hypothetical protein
LGIKQQGTKKIMVWCEIWDTKVIGPFCFTGTMTGERYLQMLRDELMSQLDILGDKAD